MRILGSSLRAKRSNPEENSVGRNQICAAELDCFAASLLAMTRPGRRITILATYFLMLPSASNCLM